jgi:catechol 2,3-dioxygenase-like lactoylglutathione lyase family enzyme
MNLEHVGLNVIAPAEAAEWYGKNLGMKVARKFGPPAFGHFLADACGQMMIEFYHNTKAPVPDYRAMNPLALHIAFQVDDMLAARDRLLKAGATPEGEIGLNDDGDQLAMLRDPWGLAIQLVKRSNPML